VCLALIVSDLIGIFHQDQWHQKTTVSMLPKSAVCKMIELLICERQTDRHNFSNKIPGPPTGTAVLKADEGL